MKLITKWKRTKLFLFSSNKSKKENYPIFIDKDFLQKAILSVFQNLSDPNFGIKELSYEMNSSRSSLYIKIRILTGKTVNEFINSIRLEQAKLLLKNESLNISEIAYKVGFRSHSYFTKCFHEKFGKSPKEFIKRQ